MEGSASTTPGKDAAAAAQSPASPAAAGTAKKTRYLVAIRTGESVLEVLADGIAAYDRDGAVDAYLDKLEERADPEAGGGLTQTEEKIFVELQEGRKVDFKVIAESAVGEVPVQYAVERKRKVGGR